MTSAPVWYQVADRLDAAGIATPVIWLGDNRHFESAVNRFPRCSVVNMNTAVHYPWRFHDINYNAEFSDFFFSPNYSRVVEVCTKLLDRLDHVGMFTRLDRELYIKYLACWALKEIHEQKPDALLMAEAPHSYAQYLIYEIFLFLKIPVAYVVAWSIQPVVMLYRVQQNDLIKPASSQTLPEWTTIRDGIVAYTSRIANSKNYGEYEPLGMKAQKATRSASLGLQKSTLQRILWPLAVEWNRNRKFLKAREYLPVNPQNFGVLLSSWIRSGKRKKLAREYELNAISYDQQKPYVLMALHYEPERTTTPDGGAFHDQFLAILELRRIVPDDVTIYVKEHSSQFHISKGIRGRSPLFYKFIKQLKNVALINNDIDSRTLVKNSVFTATITGTTAIESAIFGKQSLVFGRSWFSGLPNTIQWHDQLEYENIVATKPKSVEEINQFLLELIDQHAVPCFRNEDGINDISSSDKSDEFAKAEIEGVIDLFTQYWDAYEGGNSV